MKRICVLVVVTALTFLGGQAFAASTIQGNVTYSGSKTGDVYIGYVAGNCTAMDVYTWSEVVGPLGNPPVSFTLPDVPDGTYCVGAFLDVAGNGDPPDLGDPIGVHGSAVTVPPDATGIDIVLHDPGPLSGIWDVTVSVDFDVDGSCTYSGPAQIHHVEDLVGGWFTLTRSSGSALCPTPLSPGAVCVKSGSTLTCTLYDIPGSPYVSTGTLSGNERSASGTFQGSYEDVDFDVSWTARKRITIPAMTPWGIIIFAVLVGIGAVHYIKRRRVSNS